MCVNLNASIELHLTSKARNCFYAKIIIVSFIHGSRKHESCNTPQLGIKVFFLSRDFFILGLHFIDLYQQNEEYINSEWNVLGREFI